MRIFMDSNINSMYEDGRVGTSVSPFGRLRPLTKGVGPPSLNFVSRCMHQSMRVTYSQAAESSRHLARLKRLAAG